MSFENKPSTTIDVHQQFSYATKVLDNLISFMSDSEKIVHIIPWLMNKIRLKYYKKNPQGCGACSLEELTPECPIHWNKEQALYWKSWLPKRTVWNIWIHTQIYDMCMILQVCNTFTQRKQLVLPSFRLYPTEERKWKNTRWKSSNLFLCCFFAQL